MKLLTLNTHSLEEKDYKIKTEYFIKAVLKEKPQVIALQEVNQSENAPEVESQFVEEYYPCQHDVRVRTDNHMVTITKALKEQGLTYYWTWLPMKRGYDKYDEGIAVMSLFPITETKVFTISRADDYTNWKTRKIVGIQTENTGDTWFFSVHYSWWIDQEEPFLEQWEKTQKFLGSYDNVWLMGDFNNPAQVSGEGYDTMRKSRYKDSYAEAKQKDDGITVAGVIDGWRDKMVGYDGMRIDQIWFTGEKEIADSRVIFNGKNEPEVSDHYGLLVETEEK